MCYHFASPSIAEHLVGLRVAHAGEIIPFRHGLQPLTLAHRQLADDVITVHQLDGVLLAFDCDFPVLYLVDGIYLSVGTGHGFCLLAVFVPLARHSVSWNIKCIQPLTVAAQSAAISFYSAAFRVR